jgi:hypothetical protein
MDDERALKLASEIAEYTVPDGFSETGGHAMTLAFREIAEKAALAAIKLTTKLAADYCKEREALCRESAHRPAPTMIDGSPSQLGQDMRIHAGVKALAYERAANDFAAFNHLPADGGENV